MTNCSRTPWKRSSRRRRKTNAGVVYGYVLLRSGEQARLHGLAWAVGEPPMPAKANFWWTAVTTTGCALFRRSLIDQVGEFDETIWQAEDCEFWLRCGMMCRFAHCDTVVLKKHIIENSLGSHASGSIWWRLYLQESSSPGAPRDLWTQGFSTPLPRS